MGISLLIGYTHENSVNPFVMLGWPPFIHGHPIFNPILGDYSILNHINPHYPMLKNPPYTRSFDGSTLLALRPAPKWILQRVWGPRASVWGCLEYFVWTSRN